VHETQKKRVVLRRIGPVSALLRRTQRPMAETTIETPAKGRVLRPVRVQIRRTVASRGRYQRY
jgi:hypothetical protein